MTLLGLILYEFGPGGACFGITLITIFSFIYGTFIITIKRNRAYRRQARICYTFTCLVGGFGYMFYYAYVNLFSPILTLLYGNNK